ncbi:MAG: hypothetical protein GXX79_15340 [Actinomycetales bacterium]|nr:hypothetical protein [Actinomycetales bacterium]
MVRIHGVAEYGDEPQTPTSPDRLYAPASRLGWGPVPGVLGLSAGRAGKPRLRRERAAG